MNRIRAELALPLARYGFTGLAVLAVAAGLLAHAAVIGGMAVLAWHAHRTRPRHARRRTRRR